MKIAIVNQHRLETLGGSEIQSDLIAAGLQAKGHDVLYVAPSNKPRVESIDAPYRVAQVKTDPAAILAAIETFSPNVTYWRFNKHGFRKVAIGLKQLEVPMVFAASHINDLQPWIWRRSTSSMARRANWKRSLSSMKSQVKESLRLRWEHGGFRHVDALTVNNQEHLRHAPIADCTYIPNGMTVEVTPFSWPRAYCAWVANVKAAKRPEVAVRLAKALGQKGVDLLMVGHLQSSDYAWLVDSSSLPDNCHYLGPRSVEEVNGILAGSLLHVHTCRPEGFSNVFIQAWLHGRPSVSLGFDPSGYIREQSLGLVADDDEALFTEQVLTLVEDDKRRRELGKKAKAFASETFYVETMVERVLVVIQRTARCYQDQRQRIETTSW